MLRIYLRTQRRYPAASLVQAHLPHEAFHLRDAEGPPSRPTAAASSSGRCHGVQQSTQVVVTILKHQEHATAVIMQKWLTCKLKDPVIRPFPLQAYAALRSLLTALRCPGRHAVCLSPGIDST